MPRRLWRCRRCWQSCSTTGIICVNVLVDALMTHRLLALLAHNADDLLEAEVIPEVTFDFSLHLRGDLHPSTTGQAPILGLPLRLLVTIPFLPNVWRLISRLRAPGSRPGQVAMRACLYPLYASVPSCIVPLELGVCMVSSTESFTPRGALS